MESRKLFNAQNVVGSILILAGAGLLFENFGVIDIGPIWRFWPLILVGIGIARMRMATSRREQGVGLWLLLLGLWLTVSILHVGGLSFSDTWPALFVALGVSMIWKSLPGFPASSREKEHSYGA